MNTRILLLVLSVAALSSCSSVYKSGQTPDDVYFSPARPQADSYVEVRQEKQGSNYQTYEQYQDSYRDDRFLRMSVGNPYYLNTYNTYSGFDWRYNSFYDGYNYGFSSPWNNYFAWNNFYNPYSSFGGYGGSYGYGGGGYGYGGGYYGGGVKYTVSNTPISRPVVFNVRSYSNTSGNNRPVSRNYSGGTGANVQRYNNTNAGNGNRTYYNNNSSNGSGNRSSYTPSNAGSGNSNNTPSRSYTPSSSSGSSSSGSSSGSSSSGGGGGVSRPARGN